MAKPIWALDAVDAHLARLDAMNPKLNAVIRVLRDEARAEILRTADRAHRREVATPVR